MPKIPPSFVSGCNTITRFVQGNFIYKAASGLTFKVLDTVYPKNEVTGERHLRFIPVWCDNLLGAASYDGLCPSAKICKDDKLNARVKDVFDRLTAKCPSKNMRWEVRVMEDDKTINAFCLPGGKTVITTALIQKLETSYSFDNQPEFRNLTWEDNIAAVMGHEIVHAAAGHGARRIQLSMITYIFSKALSYLITLKMFKKEPVPAQETPAQAAARKKKEEEQEQKRKAVATGVDTLYSIGSYLFTQHHSQKNELESDKHGMNIAHAAGFNIQASIRLQHIFLEMKGKKEGEKAGLLDKGVALLASHPPSQVRLEANKQTAQVLLAPGQ